MKIIYAPEYDGENHLPLTPGHPCLLNTTYVGNAGLLAQLDLRLGVYPTSLSEVEREACYLSALRKQPADTFFAPSFRIDEMGTAHQLLRWRDTLIMAGWTPQIKGISKKLDTLAAIESDFVGHGIPDHWAAVKAYAEQENFQLTDIEIIVDTDPEDLPFLIQQSLTALAPHGISVSYRKPSEPLAQPGTALHAVQSSLLNSTVQTDTVSPDESLQWLSFNSQQMADEWFAAQSHPKDAVVVCEDATSLNHQLVSWNRPQVFAQTQDANPQITQLFKLGLSLFARPVNVYNVLSYLQLPVHPLPAKLRYQLAAVLCEEGGIGEKWQQVIDKYVFDEETKKNEETRQRKEIFWSIISADDISEKEIPYLKVVEYNKALQQWAESYVHLVDCDEATRTQLNTLTSFCKAFSIILADRQRIDSQQLLQLTRGIYRTSSYVHQRPQKDSITCLPTPASLAAPVSRLIWLDTVSKDPHPYPYDFLSLSEKKSLVAAGISIPEYSELLKMERQRLLRTVCRVQQQLTLVSYVYEGNEMTHEHAFISEMKQLLGKEFKPCTPTTELPAEVRPLDLRAPQLGMELKQIPWVKREHSNTSIDTLIQRPFDYVMQYIAQLKEPSTAELKDLKATKGQVAHYYVEQWMKEAENDVPTMRRHFEERFDEDATKAVMAKGAILLLKENEIGKTNFLQQLHESISALLSIIETQRLHPVGCEYEVAVDDFFGFGPFRARIDCLLLNEHGEYVIFDFKWSDSKDYYDKKIEKNQSIQLTLYKWAVEQAFQKKVAAVGYYLFPKYQLVTSDMEANPSQYVLRLEPAQDAFANFLDPIVNSVRYRKQELAAGHLEEGEVQPLANLAYAQDSDKLQLVPLDEQYLQKGMKSSAMATSFPHKGNSYSSNKSEIVPTTHPILKARLK